MLINGEDTALRLLKAPLSIADGEGPGEGFRADALSSTHQAAPERTHLQEVTMTSLADTRTIASDSDERVAWLPLADEANLDEDVRGLFAKAKERVGFVPNVFRLYAAHPEKFRRWRAHFNEVTLGESDLTPAEREMIAVVVSA